MAITFTKNETFDGTRAQTMPDPDNEGETISETVTGIRDIEVTFTSELLIQQSLTQEWLMCALKLMVLLTILMLLTLELLKLQLVLDIKSQLA